MAGYAKRTITIDFPELTEDGDEPIRVVIRNPKIVPWHELATRDVPALPNGQPDTDATIKALYEVIARLIVDWHVYDATSNEDDQPPLGLPATEELVGKLPKEITQKIIERTNEAQSAGA